MNEAVTRQQMEAFALALELAKQRKSLAEETFNDLHARFRARDPQGNVWTIGIHTRRWHRLVQSGGQKKWVAGAPPDRLNLNPDTRASLESLAPADSGSRGGAGRQEKPTAKKEPAKGTLQKPTDLPE